MEVPVEDTIDMWGDRPVDGGRSGLMQLQTEEFNGVVENQTDTSAFFVRGRVVLVDGGSLEALGSGPLTAREADDAGVAMLAAMRTTATDARARYYTHETPLTTVDDTLRSGGFTGYVSLARQVVSGAYYLVYHNGKRMPVAYVGAAHRTVTGEDAHELAVNEVGIYEVIPTAIVVQTIEADGTGTSVDSDALESDAPSIDLSLDPTGRSTGPQAAASDAMSAPDVSPQPPNDDTIASAGDPSIDVPGDEEPTESAGDASIDVPSSEEPASAGPMSTPRSANEAVTSHLQGRLMALEERRRELERDRDELMRQVTRVEATVEERDEQIRRLTAEYETKLSEQADTAEAQERQLEAMREEIEHLQETLAERQALVDGQEAIETEERPPRGALEQSNLFIRYADKAGPSLRDFRMQNAAIEKVQGNLTVETHTNFDPQRITIEGHPFEEYLQQSTEYRFTTWLTGDLLALIDATNNRGSLGPLFEAITAIDRVELYGEISTTVADEDDPISRPFDIIARNQVGDPLIVADVNTTTAATTRAMTRATVEKISDLAPEIPDIAAGFYVTESFYDPGALQVIADAVSSGIIPRTNKRSYVRVGRGRGFHLCLTERRGEEFYLNVPDL
jgi:hypothetical protein